MPKQPYFSQDQLAAIQHHNANMIDACDAALLKLRELPSHLKDKSILGQLAYWDHAKRAFLWSSQIASQRKRAANNEQRSTVQQSRTDTK